ncbi:iron ABC transporter substrate-binding protein [Chloroflexi bacterium TSY]|nr:iron ABC transporter substrate-binding protein [Chloroflexi bacterium TSY]
MNFRNRKFLLHILLIISTLIFVGCVTQVSESDRANSSNTTTNGDSADDGGSLVIYSGRNENLVGPLIEMYKEKSGVDVEVRYGGTAEMASVILEEGVNSPADLFFGQDAGALGALSKEGRCATLSGSITSIVDPRFVNPDRTWVGISGRARVLVYNTDELTPADLPTSVLGLTDPKWSGRVGWAPTNGSFQAFITAMRVNLGEDETRAWLEGMIANDVQVYAKNTPIVEATGAGEISVGLVNHYYLYRFLAEAPDFAADNFHFPAGDVGSMINVAGACVLDSATNAAEATTFMEYLLSAEAQQYFATETNEYPLVGNNVTINERLKSLAEIDTPEFDLGDLDDLTGTVNLLTDVGAFD